MSGSADSNTPSSNTVRAWVPQASASSWRPSIASASVTAIGRRLEPDEIAPLAVYLASDASAFTTGEQFVIDGGYTKF